jgi:hypothetical protein
MQSIIIDEENNWPFLADFNNQDVDGAVRGFGLFKTMNYKDVLITPINGQKIWLSDGDVEMKGTLSFRDGIWVAIPNEEGYKDVDEKASYHNKNLLNKPQIG